MGLSNRLGDGKVSHHCNGRRDTGAVLMLLMLRISAVCDEMCGTGAKAGGITGGMPVPQLGCDRRPRHATALGWTRTHDC